MLNKISNSEAYNQLAKFYDKTTNTKVLGVYKSIIGRVRGLNILDLGCGTGNLLKHYSLKNNTFGIDSSPEMIDVAKKKDKKSRYFVGDIRNFKLHKKFDIIVCAFDTINHLPMLKDWVKLFSVVASHLRDNGIFIFDYNTLTGFKKYNGKALFKKINKNYIAWQVKSKGKNCCWQIQTFILSDDILSKFQEFVVKEISYPINLVNKEVKKFFVISSIIKEDNNRLYLITKKRPVTKSLTSAESK